MTTPPSTPDRLPRSPWLMSRLDTALVVVDVQAKLIPLIPQAARMIWNIRRLLDAAKLLGVPAVATEQYPQGLGGTVPELAGYLPAPPAKLTFSCAECGGVFRGLADAGRTKLLVVGIEGHVCVQQTVLDLLTHGFQVYVAADAVASREPFDRDLALRRMEASGAIVTSTESALFEWCEAAGSPEFKEISRLVREAPPPAA